MSDYPTGPATESENIRYDFFKAPDFGFHAVFGGLSYVRDPRPVDRDPLIRNSFLFTNAIETACFGVPGATEVVRYHLCSFGDISGLLKISDNELLLHPAGLF